jgi:hypothetical protein
MFTAIDYPEQNLLSFTMSGQITKADYAAVVPILEAKVQRWGKVNVYLEVGNLDAMTLPALWQEIKQDVKHFTDFNRAAVVSDNSALLKAAASVGSALTPAEIKHFPTEQKAEALQWALGAAPGEAVTKQVYAA